VGNSFQKWILTTSETFKGYECLWVDDYNGIQGKPSKICCFQGKLEVDTELEVTVLEAGRRYLTTVYEREALRRIPSRL
jgi:hypothetical protein